MTDIKFADFLRPNRTLTNDELTWLLLYGTGLAYVELTEDVKARMPASLRDCVVTAPKPE